jgi:hypothetical protein
MLRRPEEIWPVDPEYAEDYATKVRVGRETAAGLDACIVGIARNAMPFLQNTLALVDEVAAGFRKTQMFVYENDSEDSTAATLDQFSTRQWVDVVHEWLNVEDTRGFEASRTERLARARNICLEWVRHHAADTTWTIMLDMDPHGGFSVDGVFHSIACLADRSLSYAATLAGGMASYSLYLMRGDGGLPHIAHYDAWAARPLCWWRDRRQEIGMAWFSQFLPPVGAPVVPMNSAFGGLAVYRTSAFLSGGYSGEDCEHVPHHRRMRQAGWQMYLNPGCRYFAMEISQ